MIDRPVLLGAPVTDRFLMVLADLDVRFNDGDMISADDIETAISRWVGDDCGAEHTGMCCDKWRLALLVWGAITASQESEG